MTTADDWTSPDLATLAKATGMVSAAEATVGLRTFTTFMGGGNPCQRCGAPATSQWQQHANDAEREAHWAALEANIRASNDGQPEAAYVADRSQPVVRAVYGCDEHDLSPEPTSDHDGSNQATARAAAEAKQAGAEARTLTHDVECGGHGACSCTVEP